MEMQIEDLVRSIRKDGVDAAKAEAEEILSAARNQAADIIANANEEAQRAKTKAESEIELLKESARVTLEHARRDAILSFGESVRQEFEKLLAADTAKTVRDETLGRLILAALEGEDPAGYAVEVAEASEGLKGELAQKLRDGLEIRVSPKARFGFRLAAKDGSGYFDCSDEELIRMMLPFFPETQI